MKMFIGTKSLKARPMGSYEYNARGGAQVPQGPGGGDTPGWLVEYQDGYTSWSPASAFCAAYRENGKMDFGHALHFLKAGRRVRRAGWNGKGMYLWLLPAAIVKAEWCREPHLKAMAEANGGEIEALGSIRMFTADKKVLTGWLASQTDMLSEDWEIIED